LRLDPQWRAPVEKAAVRRDRARNADQLRGAFRVPPELVLAGPLYAHRASSGARQDRSVRCGILVPVHAVATRALEVDQAHLVLGQTEEFGKGGLIAVRAL